MKKDIKIKIRNHLYLFIIGICFLPFMTPAIALFVGIVLSILEIKHDYLSKYTSKILQLSIILMGFGMSLQTVISASKTGFYETIISVVVVMLLGILLGNLFKVENCCFRFECGSIICISIYWASIIVITRSIRQLGCYCDS